MTVKKISDTGNAALDLAVDTIKIGKQALVFVNTKRSAEKTAEDISKKIKSEDKKLIELSGKVLKALSSHTKQCQRLSSCVKKGIAFHHAGLVAKQRELIEENFRNGSIKIICATPTLAYGLDLPAFRSIIKDLRRYGSRGLSYIPVLEYLQMSGRAGRPKFDNFGEAIVVAVSKNDKKMLFEKYIMGQPKFHAYVNSSSSPSTACTSNNVDLPLYTTKLLLLLTIFGAWFTFKTVILTFRVSSSLLSEAIKLTENSFSLP